MSAAKTVGAGFVILGACDASPVAAITPNGYAFDNSYQAFDVTCQNGRYGGVRLPRASNVAEMRLCAFRQSSCPGLQASTCMSATQFTASQLDAVYAKRNATMATLLGDAVVGSPMAWVCQ
jgi:hypothetical protein